MSHIRRRARLFLAQPFRWFIISSLFATLGNGLAYIAMTWLILQADNSVAAIAILMICFWLPSIILGPWAGVIVDKYSRKFIAILSTSLRALVLILFPFISAAHLSAFAIYCLAALMGSLMSIYNPASMALIREIVAEKDLLYANTSLDITYELGHVIGMGSAGFIISYFSSELAIMLNGLLFIIATLALLWMQPAQFLKTTVSQEALSAYQDLLKGAEYLVKNKLLSMLYFIQLLIMVIFMTTPILLAPFAKNILHANVIQFGQIEAALSVGIVIGGLFLPYYAERYRAPLVIAGSTIIAGICFIIFGICRDIWLAEVIYFIIGICLASWAIVITKAQELTDIRFQGRVQASFNALAGIGILTVYLLMYYLGDKLSIIHLYIFESLIAFLAAYLTWRYLPHLKKR